jgi:hypothetical protein
LVVFVLHLPTHGVVLSGVQHALPLQTSFAEAQLTVPLAPHGTDCPQLFVAVPHDLPAHVVVAGSGLQPHDPLVHVRPPSHPEHMMFCPQSSITAPHRFSHQIEGGVGEQHDWFGVHTPASGQGAVHGTVCPQLFTAEPPHLPAHAWALFGVQHVSSDWHRSPAVSHAVVPFEPQARTWPHLLVATPQFFPAHVVVAGSGLQPQLPLTHATPPSHPWQSTWVPQLS